MIYLIGIAAEPLPDTIRIATFAQLEQWMVARRYVQLDVETTVTPWWCDKKLITVQFGSWQDQWVLQWSELSDVQKSRIRNWLEDCSLTKVIHNALFECVVMLFHSIRIRGVFDTMLAEQVRWGGEHLVSYSLEDTLRRHLGVYLDKSEQTAFGDNILTVKRIVYAATDVKWLEMLMWDLYPDCTDRELDWVVALENEVVLSYAEMVYHGMEIDRNWWLAQVEHAQPLVGEAEAKLNEWLLKEPKLRQKAYELGYLSHSDRVLVNLNSHKQVGAIFAELFPELPGTTKAVLKRYISNRLKEGALIAAGENPTEVAEPIPEWLFEYADGNKEPLQAELLSAHREWLLQQGLLIPAGQPQLNWNSVDQVLPLLQQLDPSLQDLSQESRGRMSHPIAVDYQEFKETAKLLSTYGEKFLEKYVEPDGKVRTTFNSVMTTGRSSSAKPNMQNIPAKENVGNRYRNAFIPPAGHKFVSTDFVSQELVIIAYLSKDPVWMDALSKGQDLHSVCSELLYGQKWRDAADKDCAYYRPAADGQPGKKKCKCPKHKWMRTGIKSVDFGLAYGMSHFKLASELNISVSEAKTLLRQYFKTFPRIGRLLNYLGRFGVERGYIQTIYPFYRKRFFPMWEYYRAYIDAHIMDIQYHGGLGEIERASKNMPIQGTAADQMKMALCMVYWEIHDNGLEDLVKMAMQVHDQLDSYVREDYAVIWAKRQNEIMEQAARFSIPTGILKAETTITERWQK